MFSNQASPLHSTEKPKTSQRKIINIYFGGTLQLHPEEQLEKRSSVWSMFYEHDSAPTVSETADWGNTLAESNSIKIAFSGPSGLRGAIFGHGVEGNATLVAKKIQTLKKTSPQLKITLNMMGYSRGAVTALLTSQYLNDITPKYLEINLLLMDPVPGNSITTHKIDTRFFGYATLTQKTRDLSKCKALKNVFLLHTQHKGLTSEGRPLWAAISNPFFSPLSPTWPEDCATIEDVVSGDHSAVETRYIHSTEFTSSPITGEKNSAIDPPTSPREKLADYPFTRQIYQRCYDFLTQHGYEFHADQASKNLFKSTKKKGEEFISEKDLLVYYKTTNALNRGMKNRPTQKVCHASLYNPTKIQVDQKPYYNLDHKSRELNQPIDSLTSEDCSHRVEHLGLKKFFAAAPKNDALGKLFKSLCNQMNQQAPNTGKNKLLNRCQALRLNDAITLNRALVAFIALSLQRDYWTFYTHTTSSNALLGLLNYSTYFPIKEHILNILEEKPSQQIMYHHLESFTLTARYNAYFNSQNRDVVYREIEKLISSLEESESKKARRI